MDKDSTCSFPGQVDIIKDEIKRQEEDISTYDTEDVPLNLFHAKNSSGKTYKFKKTMKIDNLYHFKVLSLRLHEDNRRVKDHEGGSECKLEYHFFHKLLAPYK